MSHSVIVLFLMSSEYYKIKRLYSVLMQNKEKTMNGYTIYKF